MNLLDQISDALGATGALGELSSTLGASNAETDSLVSNSLPALLGGIGAQSGGDGMGALMGLLGDSGGFVDSIGSFFGQGDKTGLASNLVGSLFGSQRSAVESHIAGASGGSMSMVSRFLPMLAPAVMGLLGKITQDDELDGEGLGERLGAIAPDGPLGDLLGAGTDEDRAGFIDGIASLRDAGGLSALLPASGAATTAVAKTATGAAAGGAATTQALAGGVAQDDRDRSGLGWLAPILLGVIGLIVGLVLWQCTNSNETADDHGGDAVEEVAAPEPTAVPTEVPATPEPEPTAAPTPEPTPEPTATPAPDPVTIADLAVESPDLSALVTVAGQLGLADTLADPDAGPFTVFAPTNAAFADAAGLIENLDEDQTTQAVSFHVVKGVYRAADLLPGTRMETLTGELLFVDAVGGTLNGGTTIAQADLEADNGVVHIIEGVMVPSSLQRGLATGELNALFELEPIQFATGSADILPESIPTLDQAVEFLTNVPAGSRFEVQGHTDSQGPDEPNQTLSEARANSVVDYLTSNGVSPGLLEANGYGETQLKVDPEVTPEDFAANRRIEFVDIS